MIGIHDTEFEELPEREPAWLRLDRATVYRKKLLAAGYLPIPVNGKAPAIQGWSDIRATGPLIDRWADQYPSATNTGIITADTPAIDIDVLDSAVADELHRMVEQTIGTSAVRTGLVPKRALLFRTDTPFKKMDATFTSSDGRTHKVEILGWGQQIVVHGIHPTTQEPYTWRGGEPGPELLPLLTEEKAKEFIAAAAQCMSARGWTPKTKLNGSGNGHAGPNTFLNVQNPVFERERLYARAALDGCAGELAAAPKGTRNDVLNRKSFHLGRMVACGWIDRTEVIHTLFTAAEICGLNADDGEEATRKTLESGLNNGEKHPHPDLDIGQQEGFTEPLATRASWKYFTGAAAAPLRWLIKGILPETGAALVAGQWGTFKTTVALDVSISVMAQLPFAGRYRVKRRGAVLYIALEGEGMLAARLAAIAAYRGICGPLAFAWRGDCPVLANKNAITELCAIADEATAELGRNFGLPVVLI
jgi:hypothetical protein